jgi:hypothetical protein
MDVPRFARLGFANGHRARIVTEIGYPEPHQFTVTLCIPKTLSGCDTAQESFKLAG